jgi:hypothetical protein
MFQKASAQNLISIKQYKLKDVEYNDIHKFYWFSLQAYNGSEGWAVQYTCASNVWLIHRCDLSEKSLEPM